MRSQQIDFFRGLALIIIFIDHIYNNRLGGYTLRGFGITDAAEIFFFCSGYVSAIVYSRTLQRTNFYSAQIKATKRSFFIYFFHVVSFLALIAVTIPLSDIEGVRTVLRARGLYEMFYISWSRGLDFFTLQYQPFLFTILPAYIVLSLMTPFFAWLLNRSPAALFAVSISIYLTTQFFPGFNLVQGAHNGPWVFNPFAYQFLFVIGMLFANNKDSGRYIIPLRKDYFIIAILFLITTFLMHNFLPFLYKHFQMFPSYEYLRGLPFTGKTNEEPLRIIHFLVLMYATVFLLHLLRSQHADIYSSLKNLARPIILCGQNSIYIFTLGILLSYLGGYIIASYGNTAGVWIPVNVTGVFIMLLAGTWLSKRRQAVLKKT